MFEGDNGWIPALEVKGLHEAKAVRVEVADTILAVAARCTHQGAALDRGVLNLRDSDPTVTCPAHGSVFSLVDGRVRRGPATQPVQAFDARVNDGLVEVRPVPTDAK